MRRLRWGIYSSLQDNFFMQTDSAFYTAIRFHVSSMTIVISSVNDCIVPRVRAASAPDLVCAAAVANV